MSDGGQGSLVLVARGVSKSFRRETGEPVRALDGFDLEVGNLLPDLGKGDHSSKGRAVREGFSLYRNMTKN